jgi:peptidoglycan-N-acetylglucosamine deacetylase
MRKAKSPAKPAHGDGAPFDVLFGFDMETDVGLFTPFYEGVKHGTAPLLKLLRKHGLPATFFWTGHAAENNPAVVRRVVDAGYEIGCHSLYHETVGEPMFPVPNAWPLLPSEVEGRLREATRIVRDVSGVRPVSFRCPNLWGSTHVVNALEKLGYLADASLPLYFYRERFVPYHPSAKDWTRPGRMRIVEIPNFCDLNMESRDPYHRDRDQWPLYRTESAEVLMEKADGFVQYVRVRGKRPVLCFYLHPWEFHPMPQGAFNFGAGTVKVAPYIVKNCGPKALAQLDRLCVMLKQRGGRFVTARQVAEEYA